MIRVLVRLIWLFVISLLLFTSLGIKEVKAICLTSCPGGCPYGETCHKASACVSYCVPVTCIVDSNCFSGQVCCNGACVGAGECGGGGGSCPWSQVNCPVGSIIDLTQPVYSFCGAFCSVGSAQTQANAPVDSCCATQTIPADGCEWVNCPQVPGGPKCKEVCATPEETFCVRQTVTQYYCKPLCSGGTAPTLNTPIASAEVVSPANFSWTDIDWGTESVSGNRTDTLCVGANAADPCTGGASFTTTGATPATNYSATLTVPGDQYWAVKGTNACGSTSALSEVRSVCVEGFDVTDTNYVSNWTACDANHIHTRTCREDCGTNNCTATTLSESCMGQVTGTLFNASDYGSCPAFDPATGYLVGLPAGIGAPTRAFGFADQDKVAPHPWDPLNIVTTDPNGNYNLSVYAPATYEYDFSALSDIYVTGGGPKLTCFSNVATVPTNPVTCQTQPCTLVYGMSFGFWKMYSGWWQAVGGNVYAASGIKSEIPSSLLTEMSLILPDATMGNRRGFVSYGQPKATDMLGTNPNAKVSTDLWERESKYGGPRYDWSFYNSRFNIFATTAWSDGQAVNYDDLGVGYQIFKSAGSITSFDFSPTGTQKAIFHINGDVRVTGDIVVPSGAFLAIIAKGTITFDPSVTRADGWYIAGNISVPCEDIGSDGCDKTDSQFLGNGSFIGWNGFSLGRTRGATNNTASSEKFTYRQDLNLNAPKPMKIYTKYFKPFVP